MHSLTGNLIFFLSPANNLKSAKEVNNKNVKALQHGAECKAASKQVYFRRAEEFSG